MAKWILTIAGSVLLIGGGVWWIIREVGNLPGEAVADLGREHKNRQELEKTIYNSHPPTSGPHDPDWIRPGIYPIPQDRYKLIHSLEHGYVVVHYNCDQVTKLPSYQVTRWLAVSAHEDEGGLDADSPPGAIASPSATPNISSDCQTLVDKLTEFVNRVGQQKVVVQPNPEIDKPIVLTAWTRILKMDRWDENSATEFVRSFRGKGPEPTAE